MECRHLLPFRREPPEFADADAPTFGAVMAGLRDVAQNPEWAYMREGPEWWGRWVGWAAEAVGTAFALTGKAVTMHSGRLIGLLLIIGTGWLGAPSGAEARASATSCTSVFIQSLQEYRTVCSNGAYYTTRYRPIFRDWEMQQMFPSGPQKPPPLYRQPRPNLRQR